MRGDGVSGRDELLQQAAAPEPEKKGEDAGGGDARVGYREEDEGIERWEAGLRLQVDQRIVR